MGTQILGYNIRFKVNNKTFLGVTQEDLTIAATVKESITKDDAGNRKKRVTGHNVSFKVSAISEVKESSETTVLDSEEVLDLSLKVGSAAEIPITYLRASGASYSGTAIITNFNESSSGDPDTDTTYGLDMEISGAFTKDGSSNGQ